MNIGFVSFFAFRPHVEHLYALSKIVKDKGHNVSFLSCDSALSSCYRRELTQSSRFECMKCTVGGIRSYASKEVDSGRDLREPHALKIEHAHWGHSSTSTILRAETQNERDSPEFVEMKNRLSKAAVESFGITRNWIKKRKLDAIVCFNGRMDATRGVLEAARYDKVTYVSFERAMGDGLLLLPNTDCLGLQEVHRTVRDFRDRPLKKNQALMAAKIVASRFLKKNTQEWRAYNLNSVDQEWPTNSQRRILILPSSYNELDGHPDWKIEWKDQFDAFTNIVRALDLPRDSFVMRGHPNWSESIGAASGDTIEKHYRTWAAENGVLYIPGKSNISTKHLIAQCDTVIVNGGSAALEAGLLGKKIISLVPANYRDSGFVLNYLNADADVEKLKNHNPRETMRMTLRFLYSWCFRTMQYTREVKALDSIHYLYDASFDGDKLLNIIGTNQVSPDDASYADDVWGEQAVLDMIENNQWEEIYNSQDATQQIHMPITFERRPAFRFIDSVRALLPVGDR
jgi:hypothetical protein